MPVVPHTALTPADTEEQLADKLLPFYQADAEKFDRVIARVHVAGRSTKPAYPSVTVCDVPEVTAAEQNAFKKLHIDGTYVEWGTPEADELLQNDVAVQYTRWKWAVDNVHTFVNVLRLAGHSDIRIQAMFDGVPLCFEHADEYAQLRAALARLAVDVEKEQGWTNVNFIITGSSVPGFSQNPLKGVRDRPTRITSQTQSDVDVVIVGDGVNRTMLKRMADGEKEPKRCFPTTCSSTCKATRFGVRDFDAFSKVVADFHSVWDQKLSGGLQFTFADDDYSTPPWESRVDIHNL